MFTNVNRPSAVDVLRPFVVGDIFTADTTSTLAKVADVAVGNVLLSGGVGVIPAWGKVTLTSHVSGVLPAVNGGTGVANAGTITNASNTTITGGGTLALGGFTLTVPATGTAGLLGAANAWSAVNTFSNTTDSSSKDTGAIVTEGGIGIEKALNVGTTITCAGALTVNYNNAVATVGTGTGFAHVVINGQAATNRLTRYYTGGVARWDFAANATAESGANAGSDFTLSAYADNGAYIDDPFLVQRVAGGFFVLNRPVYSNPTTGVQLTISSTNAASITTAGGILLDGATTKTIKYTNGTANAAVAVTFGAVGPTGSTAGNQVGWLRVNVGGTDRYIPYW